MDNWSELSKVTSRSVQMGLLVAVVSAGSYAATAVNPLQETMRVALSLSDNQIAVLQGPALALPMIAVAVPLGFAIDRHSRVRLLFALTMCDLFGGVLTALASGFWILTAARCVIGLSALAVAPVGLSLIGDLYAPGQRGRAGMVMSLGQSGGVAASFALGGALVKLSSAGPNGWRNAMLWLTAPLVGVALLTLLMREPARSGVASTEPSTRATWGQLWRYRTLVVPLLVGVVMGQVALGAAYVWAAPMLTRRFVLSAERVGAILAGGLFVSGALGAVVGGALADWCQQSAGPRRTVWVAGVLSLVSMPLGLFGVISGLTSTGVLLMTFITLANSLSVMGTTLFIIAMPNELRGLSMSLLTAACVVLGTGSAPMLVSVLTGELGAPEMVGWSLSIVCAGASGVAAVSFAVSRRALPGQPFLGGGTPVHEQESVCR